MKPRKPQNKSGYRIHAESRWPIQVDDNRWYTLAQAEELHTWLSKAIKYLKSKNRSTQATSGKTPQQPGQVGKLPTLTENKARAVREGGVDEY